MQRLVRTGKIVKLFKQLNWSEHAACRRVFSSSPLILSQPISQKYINAIHAKGRLLATALNSFTRALLRVRWALVRDGPRLFAIDAVSAVVLSFVMANLLWIVLGTTTFVLAAVRVVNAMDEWLHDTSNPDGTRSRNVAEYLVSSILSNGFGLKMLFVHGTALPEFVDGKLRFHNMTVLSRPNLSVLVSAMIVRTDISLSFYKWFEGNGLISHIEVSGLTGHIRRNPNFQAEDTEKAIGSVNPSRRFIDPLDLEAMLETTIKSGIESPISRIPMIEMLYVIDHVKISDSRLMFYTDSDHMNPLKICIFSCDLPRLNGSRVVLDILNATNVSGTINEAMFTLHKRQNEAGLSNTESPKAVRFRVAGVNLAEILSKLSKLNWITSGSADFTADIDLPGYSESAGDEYRLRTEYSRLVAKLVAAVESLRQSASIDGAPIDGSQPATLARDALSAIYHTFTKDETYAEPLSEYVRINARITLRNLKARIPHLLPLSSDGIPFMSLPDLRSLIAYINQSSEDATHPLVVSIESNVLEKLGNLASTENITQSLLIDAIVNDVHQEMFCMAKADERQILSRNSHPWSHILGSQLLLLGLGVLV